MSGQQNEYSLIILSALQKQTLFFLLKLHVAISKYRLPIDRLKSSVFFFFLSSTLAIIIAHVEFLHAGYPLTSLHH